MGSSRSGRRLAALAFSTVAALSVGAGGAVMGVCGPFTDVSDLAFCPFVLEILTLGVTTGTTPTTYDPAGPVSRLQMAAFLSRTVDGVLKRASRRAALGQFWTPGSGAVLGLTSVGIGPRQIRSDGADLWVADIAFDRVWRVRGSDGRLLEAWTGATAAYGILVAMGRIFVTGAISPGNLYRIDPSQTPPGAVTTVASNLGDNSVGIAFDGSRIWAANRGNSISIVTPGATLPWTVTTVTTGFSEPFGALYDGANVWVTDAGVGTLLRLDGSGAVLQVVPVGSGPHDLVFDGANIWIPNLDSDSVSVVRASNGALLATLTGNGMSGPYKIAFDGQRVLVANLTGDSVSLWKAAELKPLGPVSLGATPYGAGSDGVNFWISTGFGKLARF